MTDFLTPERSRSRVEATEHLADLIDNSGPETLIKGTTIEAHRIAALTTGMGIDEILYDYPSLVEEQVLAAKAYAEASPYNGLPYPTITAKKAMRSAHDFSAFLPKRK